MRSSNASSTLSNSSIEEERKKCLNNNELFSNNLGNSINCLSNFTANANKDF